MNIHNLTFQNKHLTETLYRVPFINIYDDIINTLLFLVCVQLIRDALSVKIIAIEFEKG